MKLLIDTNRYTDLMNGNPDVRAVLESAETVGLPFVTIAELRAGFAMGTRGAENEKILQRFLVRDGISVIYPDDSTTAVYAAVYRDLRRKGTPIPTNDMWIASLAIQHSLILYARDSHFDRIPQVSRI